jgi:hypothetical protein
MKTMLVCLTFFVVGTFGARLSAQLPTENDSLPQESNKFMSDAGTSFGYYQVGSNQQKPNFEFLTFKPIEPTNKKDMVEDLLVLDYLIRKAMPAEQYQAALGVQLNSAAKNVGINYIEGFGITLQYRIGVDVASHTNEKAEEKSENKVEQSEWEKAKTEMNQTLLSGNTKGWATQVGSYDLPNAFYQSSQSSTFNEKLVDRMKVGIVEALQNVGNVRHLSADDKVMVFIYGPTRGNGERLQSSVLSFRVSLSDLGSSKTIAPEKIESNAAVLTHANSVGKAFYRADGGR